MDTIIDIENLMIKRPPMIRLYHRRPYDFEWKFVYRDFFIGSHGKLFCHIEKRTYL